MSENVADPEPTPSASEDQTREIARELARTLRCGDVVYLSGDLGAGKTVFARGLAEGLGAEPGQVASPTFALVHEYVAAEGLAPLVHIDLYRIPPGEIELREIGIPEILEGRISVIEWPTPSLEAILPPTHRVRIRSAGPGRREISVRREEAACLR
jgi:tRNA threonylcarbamoyladenosine biosynthesis protein TsaE